MLQTLQLSALGKSVSVLTITTNINAVLQLRIARMDIGRIMDGKPMVVMCMTPRAERHGGLAWRSLLVVFLFRLQDMTSRTCGSTSSSIP
jgi:hypothetical protein